MNQLKKLLEATNNTGNQMHLWLLPYSTLMIILMVLFAMLYSMSTSNTMEYEVAAADMGDKKQAERAKQDIKLAKDMQNFIKNMNMEGLAEVSITAHAIKIKLSSPVIFDSGSADLKPDIMPLLIELLKHLKDMSNTIIVEGHTDNIPMKSALFRSNWELSAARAFSVIYFYIQRGIDPKRLLAYGYGEMRPFFPNDSEIGKAMNRRIEITILRGRTL